MEKPLVSVIIPCYNAEKYVEASVRSIMEQSYKNLEILLADDASNDATLTIIKNLEKEDERIKIIKHEENRKIVKTLNELVSVAKGKYIARMDADDISLPNRIEEQVKFLENNPRYAGCGVAIQAIDKDGKKIHKSFFPCIYSEARFASKFFTPLCHPTALFKGAVLRDNPYDEDFIYAEDYELWCRLMLERKYEITNLDKVLFYYRFYTEQTSFVRKNEQNQLMKQIFIKYEFYPSTYLDIHSAIFYEKSKAAFSKEHTKEYLSLCRADVKENRNTRSAIAVYSALLNYLIKSKQILGFPSFLFSYSTIKVCIRKVRQKLGIY